MLLAVLVVVPAALAWRFASPSFFFLDDIIHLYDAHTGHLDWSYAFGSAIGHLAPGYRLTYLAIDRAVPMNFDVALAFLVLCQAVSAVLLQRILTLVFGRAWWTYALAFAWAISVAYLPAFGYFAAGLHSIPAIAATLASIHGYLCWRATGRRGWLVWSLLAMVIGVTFYEKALLVPLYLILIRFLLDPGARLRDTLRLIGNEWRVWLAYASVWAAFLIAYSLGSHTGAATAPVDQTLDFLRLFWIKGLWPLVFGIWVPEFGQSRGDQMVMVSAQLALIGLVAWSIARRSTAWRAWAFLAIAVVANALMLIQRVSTFGPEATAYSLRYYTEPILLVPIAVAFAFARPRPLWRTTAVEQPASTKAAARGQASFQRPTRLAGAVALTALVAYLAVTLATTDSFSKPWSAQPSTIPNGRLARSYFDNLRGDLQSARGGGAEVSLLDHDVPPWIISPLAFEAARHLSYVVSHFDERVTFNQPQALHIVEPGGHLRPTHFVPAAGGSLATLRRGSLRIRAAGVMRRRGELCIVGGGTGAALEWEPRPHVFGHDWWLRAAYRTDAAQPVELYTNPGFGFRKERSSLPSMNSPGTAILPLTEFKSAPANAGVRLVAPPFGRLCLRSLEIGYFDPPAPR